MKVVSVVGARPNFVKIAPLMHAMHRHPDIAPSLVHTGQHYDTTMSRRFFEELEIPEPDVNLGVGSGSHAVQTADVMKGMEPVLETLKPDVVLVVGDVNSTLAAALTAAKLGIPVAHVEAGLRSFDRTMPEELNRILTDAISDVLFVTEESGTANLLREGVSPERIHMVGNVMIDALEAARPKWESSDVVERFAEGSPFAVLTLHRPSNIDEIVRLDGLLTALERIAQQLRIIFPVHPRTRQQLERHRRLSGDRHDGSAGLQCIEPLGYVDFVGLMSRAQIILTDSGGVQEESTILGVPCLTLRENTERPVTVTHGTNRIVGTDPDRIVSEALRVLNEGRPLRSRPPLWDGQAADRIVQILSARYQALAS